jgi:hypothetical protein
MKTKVVQLLMIVSFSLGILTGISLTVGVEVLSPYSRAISHACYKNGDMTFRVSIDGKIDSDNKFYPIGGVSIDSIHWFYHTAILRDVKRISCPIEITND